MDLSRAYGANSEVAAYCRRINALYGTDVGAVWAGRLTSCLETIYSALGGRANGRAALVDLICLGNGLNVGTGNAFLSLRGRLGTLGGTTNPSWLPEGVFFDGVSQYGQLNGLPDVRTGTVAMVCAGSYTAQTDNGSIFSIAPTGGIAVGTAFAMVWGGTKAGGAGAQGYTRQGGAATVCTALVGGTNFLGWGINEASWHTYIITNDNAASPSLNFYVDGNLSLNDNAGNTQCTATPCSRLTIGAWDFGGPGSFSRMTIQAFAIFNRVLTSTEVSAVNRALQYLQIEDFILATEGDSTSYFNNSPASNPAPGSEWPAQLKTALGGNSSRWRVQNWAFTGDTLTNMLATWPNQIQQLRPGGRYRDGACMVWGGVNDLLGGATWAQVLSRLQSLWIIARENGFKVITGTLMPGTGYTGAQNTERLAANALIRANSSYYDNLIEADILFPDPAASYFFDGFHLTPTGYATMALAVRKILRI